MKILLLGEYSNVHNTLSEGLRQLGHDVTLISNGDFWKDYPRDINLQRTYGHFGGLRYYIKAWWLLHRMRDYDIVQFINPMFLELRAERIFRFFRYLRRHNRKLVLGAFGMDYYWVHECVRNKPLRYSDFTIAGKLREDVAAQKYLREWMGTIKESLNIDIAMGCDKIITGLYEYDVCYRPNYPNKTTFIPYPIKVEQSNISLETPEKIRFFIGISKDRSEYKGTDIMLRALLHLKENYPDDVELMKAEGVPFKQYETMMNNCDVVLDQLYSYTPAMNGLLAMSKGKVLVGGGEEEGYEILGEKELRPIINVLPDEQDVYSKLEDLVKHKERIPTLKAQSMEYIRRHHDHLKVAKQYVECYKS